MLKSVRHVNSKSWSTMPDAHTKTVADPSSMDCDGESLCNAHMQAEGLSSLDAVRDFHKNFYSANVMRLAVVGRQPLDELEALVRRTFAAVPNKELTAPAFDADILDAGTQPLLRMVPEKEGNRLELQWLVPPEHVKYRVSPCGYLGHLLG